MPVLARAMQTPEHSAATQNPIPSIRLISATPSASGLSSEGSICFNQSLEDAWNTLPPIPASLAPKPDDAPRKKLVPKKSKLSILGVGRDKERGKDLSDVVRRVGGNSASATGGFEIYVDPTVDQEVGEIVVVKKKKSRAALHGMSWGALGEVTNVPKTTTNMTTNTNAITTKENPAMSKVKTEKEGGKWWSIGRGRKDSKDKSKEKMSTKPVEIIHNPNEPMKTSDTSKPVQESRGRSNSLDSGLLLGFKTMAKAPSPVGTLRAPSNPELHAPPPPTHHSDVENFAPATYSRSATPTAGGLFAGPSSKTNSGSANQGSIALRAMRSVRSIARIGSWSQLKSMPAPTAQEMKELEEKEKAGKAERKKSLRLSKVKKETKDAVEKEKKGKREKDGTVSKKKMKAVKEEKKAPTRRMSSSSFEVGALTASPTPPTKMNSMGKKRSILGLGLPSTMTMRLPTVRVGSASSSTVNLTVVPPSARTTAAAIAPTITDNRLFVESAAQGQVVRVRSGSAASGSSNGSSLRPLSTTSSNSRVSSGSSTGSVRWDEEALQTVREQRRLERLAKEDAERQEDERKERSTSRESRRSSEARRRPPLSSIFPEGQHHAIRVAMLSPLADESANISTQDSEEGGAVSASHVAEAGSDVDARSVRTTSTKRSSSSSNFSARRGSYPILTIEEATLDGHECADWDEPLGEDDSGNEVGKDELGGKEEGEAKTTPVKKARARPLSEHMLGRSRPKPMYVDEDGVLSILSAATNDLALLINNLDLQATPGTPDMTPLRPSPLPTIEKDASASTSLSVPASIEHNGSPKPRKVASKRPPAVDTSLKGTLRTGTASVSSLRPYAQSRGYTKPKSEQNTTNAPLLSQRIAPWATLMQGLSPVKDSANNSSAKTAPSSPTPTPKATFRPGHRRSMTPAPEPEPEPVFQPLNPARARAPLKFGSGTIRPVTSGTVLANVAKFEEKAKEASPSPQDLEEPVRAPSSMTFGHRSPSTYSRRSRGSIATMDEFSSPLSSPRLSGGSLTPVFKRIHESEKETERKRTSRTAADYKGKRSTKSSRSSRSSGHGDERSSSFGVPLARETRKVLGMSGTMGGSDVSCYQVPKANASEPDSDVPDELRFLLATHSIRGSITEGFSFDDDEDVPRPPTAKTLAVELASAPPTARLPDVPPILDLPVFSASLIDDEDNSRDLEDGAMTPDDDTKKSFDFTGEIQKLNESEVSDRRSFAEQLENAFRTPATIDLRYDFGGHLRVDVPPVPALPLEFKNAMEESVATRSDSVTSSHFDNFPGVAQSQLVDVERPSMLEKTAEELQDSKSKSDFNMFSVSCIADVKEPTLFPTSDRSDHSHEMVLDNQEQASHVLLGRSTSSNPSDGRLNTLFKFGGLPRTSPTASLPKESNKPLTLSDIIPPPSHARQLSETLTLDQLEDDSVLKSIYAKIIGGEVPERQRVDSTSSLNASAEEKRRSIYRATSRPTSGISFMGFDSFDEVRRGFEFSNERPAFYPPPSAARRPHRYRDSMLSIASVSSYGHVIHNGAADPFDYGLPSLRERPSSEDMSSISMSLTVDDTFAFLHDRPRRRVESDASSFYFHAPVPHQNAARGHRRRESNMSISSLSRPISLHNRGFGHHRRNDSTASASSVAMSYARHSAASGISAWARHRKRMSTDSVTSDFSAMNLGRPGLGDKMFDNTADLGPLSSVSGSPSESACQSYFARPLSFDSIMDDDPRSVEDSLFEKTGYRHSTSGGSVFRDNYSYPISGGFLPPHQFRPLSVMSNSSAHSPPKEDDTMISMLGGGHVRRRSIGSIMEASPCVRVEKRKHSAFQDLDTLMKGEYESPNKARIVEKPSIASTSSLQFGGERMIKAQRGLLERRSLEDSCLIADGEELASAYCSVPVFTRPGPVGRSRSSTCTSSSGGNTPPLSASGGSSISGGSQSSIDLSQVNVMLSNATHPMSNGARHRARARARGAGHRRRYSKAPMSRSSVYETIEEESSNSPTPNKSFHSKLSSPIPYQQVYVVDSDTADLGSPPGESTWDDERGIVALRKFYALRDEAHVTVTESKRVWRDTPFSIFALQSFQAPDHPAGMQALLEHSVQNYGPLPSELRPRRIRSRTSSRPSPYPQNRISKVHLSPEHARAPMTESIQPSNSSAPVLRQLPVNNNLEKVAPSLEVLKPFAPLVADLEPKQENVFGLAPNVRPQVGSSARRMTFGWSKRSTGKTSTDQKENVVATGSIATPGDGLRLHRPRPRGRPTPGGRTPASQARAIRI